jgi:hypothetical protein
MNVQRRVRRVSARVLVMAAASAMLAPVLSTVAASSASADPGPQARPDRPVYRCEFVRREGERRVEGLRCRTFEGPHRGFVREPIIEGWRDGRFEGRFACRFGEARLPERIVGFECEPIFG